MGSKATRASSSVQLPIASGAKLGCSSSMKIVGCKEMFAEFFVEQDVAKQNVPQYFEVRIHPNGKAMLLLLVQDCEKGVLNGLVRISPLRMAQICSNSPGHRR